mmetsp:Transcript_10687/g.15840  ORF Transcript_10687/g.15840 Transcript_10687/m.15840 type:complete len:208 (-) Transcript_10687:52-675(-)
MRRWRRERRKAHQETNRRSLGKRRSSSSQATKVSRTKKTRIPSRSQSSQGSNKSSRDSKAWTCSLVTKARSPTSPNRRVARRPPLNLKPPNSRNPRARPQPPPRASAVPRMAVPRPPPWPRPWPPPWPRRPPPPTPPRALPPQGGGPWAFSQELHHSWSRLRQMPRPPHLQCPRQRRSKSRRRMRRRRGARPEENIHRPLLGSFTWQ